VAQLACSLLVDDPKWSPMLGKNPLELGKFQNHTRHKSQHSVSDTISFCGPSPLKHPMRYQQPESSLGYNI